MTPDLLFLDLVLAPPGDSAARGAALDRVLVSGDLPSVIADLRALRQALDPNDAPPPGGLAALLGEDRDAVVDGGLATVPWNRQTAFLKHPELLTELQDLVLLEGHAYWRDLLRADPGLIAARAAIAETADRESVTDIQNPNVPETPPPIPPIGAPSVATPPSRRGPGWRTTIATALAASVLAGIGGYSIGLDGAPPKVVEKEVERVIEVERPVPTFVSRPGAGWSDPPGLAEADTRETYLQAFASAARERLEELPETAPEMAAWIDGFRGDCRIMIFKDHPLLADAGADALRARCRRWGSLLDTRLQLLEAGENPAAVREAIVDTVERLIDAFEGESFLTA